MFELALKAQPKNLGRKAEGDNEEADWMRSMQPSLFAGIVQAEARLAQVKVRAETFANISRVSDEALAMQYNEFCSLMLDLESCGGAI